MARPQPLTRLVAVSLLVVAAMCVARPAHAASNEVAIASFSYRPMDVRIAVGDMVEWTNLDATVHTVTASRGEFSSGSMRRGQKFSARFTVPGVYPYFCEPHEYMTGTVSVLGPSSPATSTTTTSTTTVAAAGATTIPATGPLSTSTIPPDPIGSGPPVAIRAPVVAGPVTGDAPASAPWPTAAGFAALVLLAALVLMRAGVATPDALRHLAASCTAVTGLVHLQLRFALAYPEPIGTLLVIEAATAALLAVWLSAQPWSRPAFVTAAGFHVAALAALAVTRTDIGLFGFHEFGWDPSPQLPLALSAGFVALALLAARQRATRMSI